MRRDIVVMGGSAGSIDGCRTVLSFLPPDFPASIFITIHTAPGGPGLLANLLAQVCSLPVQEVRGRAKIEPGSVYVAPPNLHLVVKRGRADSRFLPKENGTRPAIDVMFRSAAHAYSRRVIGVLVSGSLDDGVAGLGIIKDEGGVTIVQDPEEARFPDMPLSAVQSLEIDHVVSIADIAHLLVKLVGTEIEEEPRAEVEETMEGDHVLTCPGCGGVLREYKDKKMAWFQCQVGHRYSIESMVKEQDANIESRLWTTIALLKQKQQMAETMAADARSMLRATPDPEFFEKQAEASKKAQEQIEKVLSDYGAILFPGEPPKSAEKTKEHAGGARDRQRESSA